jgi:hypothetical protein
MRCDAFSEELCASDIARPSYFYLLVFNNQPRLRVPLSAGERGMAADTA